MKLILENFRCFSNLTLNTNDIGTILLNGNSGIGKSTIFKAIYFVLFNKEQKVLQYGKKKCKVEFHYQNLIITRSKNPNTLTIQKDNTVYQDLSAQEIINKHFGVNFNLTGYIAQKNIEGFFQLSKDQKATFLQNLAIDNFPIETLKNNVKQEIKKYKDLLYSITSKLDVLNSLNNFEITSKPVFNTSVYAASIKYSSNDQTYLNNLYNKIKLQIQECNNKIIKLNQTINILQKEKEEYIKNNQNLIFYKEKLNKFDTTIKLKSNTSLINELSELKQQKEENIKLNTTKQKYSEHKILASSLTKKISENKKKINNLNINLEVEKLHLIKHLLAFFKCQSIDEIKNIYTNNMFELNNFKLLLIDEETLYYDTKRNNQNLLDEIVELQNNTQLKCPNCECRLILTQNKELELMDKNNSTVDINELKSKIKELTPISQKIESYNSKIKKLEIAIEKISSTIDIENEKNISLNEINSQLNLYTTKTKIETETESFINELKLVNKYIQECENNIQKYKEIDISNIEETILKYSEIVSIHNEIKKYSNSKTTDKDEEYFNVQTNEINNELYKLNSSKNELEKEELELYKYKEEYKEYEIKLKKYEEYCLYIDKCNNLKEEEEKVRKQYLVLDKLLTKISLSESETLEHIIDTINLHLMTLMDKFFQSDLTMYLTSTKTMSNGEKRYTIDFTLLDSYQNEIGIENLSGGEYDRCALALFLIFNKLTNTPILMLDECLSSLHMDSIIEIVDTIKEMFSDKLILVTLHQANTGMFDEVIDIGELKDDN